MTPNLLVDVCTEADVAVATTQATQLLRNARVRAEDIARIITVVSELSRNIVKYAQYGDISICLEDDGGMLRVTIQAQDRGPGIPDTSAAMRDGFTTGGTLGMGLPGVRRLMDAFELSSRPGKGTCVTTSRQVRRQ